MWPLVLVTAGAALLWRQSAATASSGRAVKPEPAPEPEPAEAVRERAVIASRTGVGVALVITAGLVFLQATGALSAARDVVLAVLVAVVVLGVIFAPWIMRLVRSLGAERARADPLTGARRGGRPPARLRAPDAGDGAAPRRGPARGGRARAAPGARAARRGCRRAPESARGESRLAAALQDAAEEVESAHGVKVDVVAVGDRELDDRAEALVAAAREAMTNAAKFGGGSPVAVYAEVSGDGARCSCATAGPGSTRPPCREDRRGVRESIVGRMERNGGRARVTSQPGGGTEVELTLMSGPRVVIVDDHGLFRAGVRAELEELVDMAGDAGHGGRGGRARSRRSEPDVVLLDVHMPDGGGVEVIRRVAPEHPAVRFLALSASDAAEDVIAVIRAGARGYVTKTISGEELADAVRRVHDGDAVFSPRLAGFVLDSFAGAPPPAAPGAGRRARPAHPARARGAPAHRARLHVQGDRPRPGHLGEDRGGARVGGAAQAAAVEPARAVPLGGGAGLD